MNKADKVNKRYYTVSLGGYGCEFVIGKITKEQYEFWSKREEEELSAHAWSPDDESSDNPVHDRNSPYYLGEWYELGDITQECAMFIDGDIYIAQLSGPEFGADEIDTFYEGPVTEFISKYGCKVKKYKTDLNKHVDNEGHCYLFLGVHEEKGGFFDGKIEVNGEPDWSKLEFNYEEMLNGDTIVWISSYDGKDLDNDGGGTTGKYSGFKVIDYPKDKHILKDN